MAKRPGHALGHQARSRRPHVGFVVAAALFAAIFLALALSEFHAPSPHGVPVGIVAPAAVTGQVEEALGNAVPGGFDLRIYPSEAVAQAAIAHDEMAGALIASPGGMRLLEAPAGGTAVATALTKAFTAVAAGSGQSLTVTDVVAPLPNDSFALSPFFICLAIMIPSLAAGSASALVFRRSGPAWGVAAPIVVAVVLGAVAAGIADGIAGLGSYWAIAAIVALFSLAIAAPTAALARFWPPLTALALLAFLVLGLPASGGPSNLAAFGPGFLRALHSAVPLGMGASAVRAAVYFDGYGAAGPLWTLAAWAVGGVIALAMVIAWRRGRAQQAGALQAQAVEVPAVSAQAVPSQAVLARQGAQAGAAFAAAAAGGHSRHAPMHAAGARVPVMAAAVPATAGTLPVRAAGAWPGPDGAHADEQDLASTAVFPEATWRPYRDRPEPFPPFDVVVGFDNSAPARRALTQAARLVTARPGTLHIVYADHVVIDSDLSGFAHAEMEAARDQEAAAVAEAAASVVTHAGIPYTFERRQESPAEAILSAASAYAAEPEGPVIVVGRSRHAARHLLGSVPVHLLHNSPYPVLTIP